jgi:hypothetical protein
MVNDFTSGERMVSHGFSLIRRELENLAKKMGISSVLKLVDGEAALTLNCPVSVVARFFSGVPHAHLLGVCRRD